MSEPYKLPEWGVNANPSDIVEPPGQVLNDGLKSGDFLLREWLNWYFNLVYLWIVHLKTKFFSSDNGVATITTDDASFHVVQHVHLGAGQSIFISDVLFANDYFAANAVRSQLANSSVVALNTAGDALGFFKARNTCAVLATINLDGTINQQAGVVTLTFNAAGSDAGLKKYDISPAIPTSSMVVQLTLQAGAATMQSFISYILDGAGSEITVRTINEVDAPSDRAFNITIYDIRP